MEIQLKNNLLTLTVDTFGAQMKSICSADGTEYLWQGDSRYWGDCAPHIFPFIGSFTGNKYTVNGITYSIGLHGFASSCEYQLLEWSHERALFSLMSNHKTKKQYPFDFSFYVEYAVNKDTVAITYAVHNSSNCTMPFAIGGHPGFRVPLLTNEDFSDYYLEFENDCKPERIGFTLDDCVSGEIWPFPLEERKIPLQHKLFDDDAVILKNIPGEVKLCSAKSGRGVRVAFPKMPYIGFWHCPKTEAPFVCIEPWSSLPGRQGIVEEVTYKSDLIQLPADNTYTSMWSITVF